MNVFEEFLRELFNGEPMIRETLNFSMNSDISRRMRVSGVSKS